MRSRNHCWKSSKSYIIVCVRVRARKCVCMLSCMCVWVCVCGCMSSGVCFRACSLTKPTWNAAPYCHLRPFCFHHNIIGKKFFNIECLLLFCQQRSLETFLILRRIQRGIVISVKTYLCKVPIIRVGFKETWIFSTDFEKLKYQI